MVSVNILFSPVSYIRIRVGTDHNYVVEVMFVFYIKIDQEILYGFLFSNLNTDRRTNAYKGINFYTLARMWNC